VYIGLSGEVILGDFGYVHAGKQERIHPFWVAPERIHNAGCDCDMKADIWNIGTLANYMLDGHNPYHNETLVNALMLCSTAPIPKIKNRGIWSQELVRFIRMCHQPKPEDRPTAAELLGTPFIDFVEQMSRA
jgi:serine/threonine protein kinase